MRGPAQSFTIDCPDAQSARIAGVLRLSSPAEYEPFFEPLCAAVDNNDSYTIDLSGVRFMNSSGITSLSRLVLRARSQSKPLTLVGAEGVSWQTKTLTLLCRLHDKLEVQFV